MRAPFLFFMITVISASQTVRNLAGRLTGALFNGFNLARGNFTFGGCVGGGEPAACGLIGGELTATCVEGVLTLVDAFTIPEGDPFAMVEIVVTDGNGVEFGAPITEAGGSITVNDGDGGLDFSAGDLTIIGAVVTEGCPGKSFSVVADKPGTPKITLVKSQSNGTEQVVIGQEITYSIDVTNDGTGDSTGGVLTDLLPSQMTFVSANLPYDPVTGIWNPGVIAPGQTVTLEIVATVNDWGETPEDIANTATFNDEQGTDVLSGIKAIPVPCDTVLKTVVTDNDAGPTHTTNSTTPVASGWNVNGLGLMGSSGLTNNNEMFVYLASSDTYVLRGDRNYEIISKTVCEKEVAVSAEFSPANATSAAELTAALNVIFAENGLTFEFGYGSNGAGTEAGTFGKHIYATYLCKEGEDFSIGDVTIALADDHSKTATLGFKTIESITCSTKFPEASCEGEGGGGDVCDPCGFQVLDHLNGNAVIEPVDGVYNLNPAGEYYFQMNDCGEGSKPVTVANIKGDNGAASLTIGTNGWAIYAPNSLPAGSYQIQLLAEGCRTVATVVFAGPIKGEQ